MWAICIWLGLASSRRRAIRRTFVGAIVAESWNKVLAEKCVFIADCVQIVSTIVAEKMFRLCMVLGGEGLGLCPRTRPWAGLSPR